MRFKQTFHADLIGEKNLKINLIKFRFRIHQDYIYIIKLTDLEMFPSIIDSF